jgi:hypothetical protein
MAALTFTSSNLIDAIQNESVLWDTNQVTTEEDKELAWQRIADIFGLTNGNYIEYYSRRSNGLGLANQ